MLLGVVEGSPVLFGRAGQLSGVGGQVAVRVPELSGGGVGGEWGVLPKCMCVSLSLICMCCQRDKTRVS